MDNRMQEKTDNGDAYVPYSRWIWDYLDYLRIRIYRGLDRVQELKRSK